MESADPGVKQGLDLLGRMVDTHCQRNVPASGLWFKQILDKSEQLPSWDQLAEEVLWEHSPERVEEGFWGWPREGGEEGKGGLELQC